MTSLLLDTHVALWWLADDRRLTPALRAAVEQADGVHLSAASTWEVAIKVAIGKLEVDGLEEAGFAELCAEQGFSLVPVSHEDAWSVLALPVPRTDPFDRLIAATARRRGWTVATADPVFDVFGVSLLRP